MKAKTAAKISFVAILILCASFVCQNIFADTLPLKSYTSADGLGSSTVSFEMRDSRGFLWFCTRDGLSRFDGSRFVTYQVGDQTAPPGVESIFESREGIYWISTTGGLYRYDPNAPVPEINQNGGRPALNARHVSNDRGVFFQDRAGNIWFGSNDLFQIKEEKDGTVSLLKFPLNLPPNPNISFAISAVRQGRDDSLWVTTHWGLVRRLPDGREILYSIEKPKTDLLTSLLEDRAGRIWVGASTGVYVLMPETLDQVAQLGQLTVRRMDGIATIEQHSGQSVHLPTSSGEVVKYSELASIAYGKYLYETADGHIWMSTGSGVVEFDGSQFIEHTTAKALLNGVGQILEDSSNNLWLAWSTGLFRFERKGFTTYDAADGLNSPSIITVNETIDGNLFVATTNFFLSQFNKSVFETIHPNLAINARSLWTSNAIYQDSRGEWWFLTNEHLYRFAATNNVNDLARQQPLAIYDSKTELTGDQMFHIFEDSHGDLWVSNRDAVSAKYGLSKFDHNTQKFYTFSATEGFPAQSSITSFAEDKSGVIWMGGYEEGGLFRYSNGRFTRIEGEDVPKGVLTSMLIDRSGRLWIASSIDGLSRVDDVGAEKPAFARYTIANGLASNNVRSLAEDKFGNIYAGSARGINRISADGIRIRHYSVSDGLAGDFVNAAFRDSNDVLWFGTPNGLSRLAAEPDKEATAPPILLGGLRIAGQSRPMPELGSSQVSDLDLSYTQNNLQIDYFGIDFNAGESLRYQYMLEGADKEWSAPVEQRTVTFANLAPATYRFMVRAINADGAVSQSPATVSFRITPPFWRRWWFITGVILLVGFAVFSLDRYRITKTRQIETALGKSIESETRFRTLAETASDAIITIDTRSNIVFINEAVEKVFGYSSEELIGAKLTILMPEGLRPHHDSGLNRYLATDKKNIGWSGVELPARHKSGREIPLEVSFGEFELNGERYFTGVARDISERKHAEQALQKSREERFKELERVRTRIATDLHDDIGSSLTQIAVLSEVVQGDAARGTDDANPHLRKISSVSIELMQAMGDIVWAINPRNDTMPNLIKRMRRFASDIFSAGKIQFELETPEVDDEAALGANIRREVFAIFKECVNNISRHSACVRADITLEIRDEHLRMRFRDDGRGFDAIEVLSKNFSPETGGNGLINIRRRTEDLGGTCLINAEPGKGTTIEIDIPFSADGEIHTSHVGGGNGGG